MDLTRVAKIFFVLICFAFLMQNVWGITVYHSDGGFVQYTSPDSPYPNSFPQMSSIVSGDYATLTIEDLAFVGPSTVVCDVTPGQVLITAKVSNQDPVLSTLSDGIEMIRDDGKRYWGMFWTRFKFETFFQMPDLNFFFKNGEPLFSCNDFPVERVYTFYIWHEKGVYGYGNGESSELLGSFDIEVTGGGVKLPECGDGICSNEVPEDSVESVLNEDCWTCSQDCGACPKLIEPIMECGNPSAASYSSASIRKSTLSRDNRRGNTNPQPSNLYCPFNPATLVPIQSVGDPNNPDSGSFQCGYLPELNVCSNPSPAFVQNVCAVAPAGCAYVAETAVLSAAFVIGSFIVFADDIYTMIYDYKPFVPYRDLWLSDFYLNREYNKSIDDFITNGVMPPDSSKSDFEKRCKDSYKAGKKYFDKNNSRPVSIQTIRTSSGIRHIYTSTNKGKLWRCEEISEDEYLRGLDTGRFQPIRALG